MQQDFALDPADTMPIRRFVKLRTVSDEPGVYRTDNVTPLQHLWDLGWKRIRPSVSHPGRWYVSPPTTGATNPFPITVQIPTEKAILALASKLIAVAWRCDYWRGTFGDFEVKFLPDGPRDLCGTYLSTFTEAEKRWAESPGLFLRLPLLWHTSLRWLDGLNHPPEGIPESYVSHLKYSRP